MTRRDEESGRWRISTGRASSRLAAYGSRELLAVGLVLRPQLLAQAGKQRRRHMEKAIADPELRRQLTPDYRMGCKPILLSNDFYPAIAAANASLVTEKITEVTAGAVVTADGVAHPVDTIIAATGFHVTDNPMFGKITGRGGRTLASAYDQTYQPRL